MSHADQVPPRGHIARLAPCADPAPQAQAVLQKLIDGNGRVHNFFATLAHQPQLLRRVLGLSSLFLGFGNQSVLAPRDRELVVLRTAWRTHCEYEFGQHTRIGLDAGLTRDEVAALVLPEIADRWSKSDRYLIALADELSAEDAVGAETWTGLERYYDAGQMVELIMLAGFFRMVAGFLNSCRVEDEHDSAGWPEPAAGA